MCTSDLPHQYSPEKRDFTSGDCTGSEKGAAGFGLIEVLMALLIMTFGLLAVGQLIYLTAGAGSLARSKGTATIAAQNKLEYLSDLYRRDPGSVELSEGTHGPEQTESLNPITGVALNRFGVSWNISNVPDPRPGKTLQAKLVSITVTPVRSGGAVNTKPSLNKILYMNSVISPRNP
jgi:hypothetical protein